MMENTGSGTSMKEKELISQDYGFRSELVRVGGEQLHGSGFENEIPDPEFSASVPAPGNP
jgi:hypothetical protein